MGIREVDCVELVGGNRGGDGEEGGDSDQEGGEGEDGDGEVRSLGTKQVVLSCVGAGLTNIARRTF